MVVLGHHNLTIGQSLDLLVVLGHCVDDLQELANAPTEDVHVGHDGIFISDGHSVATTIRSLCW